MPRPMGQLRILFSSRVLLDLEEADKIFKEQGKQAYTNYILCRGEYEKDFDPEIGGRRLRKGPLFDVALALHRLNEVSGNLVEIGMSCKDETDTALPVFRNLDVLGVGQGIEYRIATAGKALGKPVHEMFSTDLLLTRSTEDAQTAIDMGIAAAVINFPPEGTYDYAKEGPIRLFVDGDAVAFGSGAEVRFRKEGLETYRRLEGEEFNKSIEPGPFTAVLAKISQLNDKFPDGQKPFEITLLTARGNSAGARVFTIAQSLGIKFNGGAYFMGGAPKHEALKAHRPHLFVDDQMTHLTEGSKYCPTGLVCYATGSEMYEYLKEQAKIAAAKDNAADVTSAPKQEGAPAAESTRRPRGPRPPSQG